MAAGFTTIRFGNVVFFRVQTRDVRQEPVYDDSNTNFMYMRTTVEITGYLNGRNVGVSQGAAYNLTMEGVSSTGALPLNGPRDPFGFASERERQIRRQLGPRQRFQMVVGDLVGNGSTGQSIIDCYPAPTPMLAGATFVSPAGGSPRDIDKSNIDLADTDLNNGPRCTSFRITKITGDEIYEISASFEICQLECDANGDVDNNDLGVLSNRWSCRDSLDANLRTTRTYTGHLRLASANLNAQMLRYLVLPPLVQMFRRDSFTFDVSEDGLTLNWMVTDIEAAHSCPYPAKTWHVSHQISNADVNNVQLMSLHTIDVDLTGDVNVDKGDLVELAMYIISAKTFGCTPDKIGTINNAADLTQNFWGSVVIRNLEFVDITGDEARISARATIQTLPVFKQGRNGNVVQQCVTSVAKRFATPMDNDDLYTTTAKEAKRPAYDRTFSWGGYFGDKIPYASPAAGVVNIFLNYMQVPCDDDHATADPNKAHTTPPGNVQGRAWLNMADIDRNVETKNSYDSPVAYQNPPSVNISVYPKVDPLAVPSSVQSASQLTGAYTSWRLENLYETKTLKCQVPIARKIVQYEQVPGGIASSPFTGQVAKPLYKGDNFYPTSAIASLAGPQTKRTLRVSAERIGSEPQFPDPDQLPMFVQPDSYGASIDGDDKFPREGGFQIHQVCLEKRLRPSTAVMTASGQYLYRAEAEYVIGLSRAPNPGERLDLGNDMWAVGFRPFPIQTNSDGDEIVYEGNQTTIGKHSGLPDVNGNTALYPGGMLTAANWGIAPDDTTNTTDINT